MSSKNGGCAAVVMGIASLVWSLYRMRGIKADFDAAMAHRPGDTRSREEKVREFLAEAFPESVSVDPEEIDNPVARVVDWRQAKSWGAVLKLTTSGASRSVFLEASGGASELVSKKLYRTPEWPSTCGHTGSKSSIVTGSVATGGSSRASARI